MFTGMGIISEYSRACFPFSVLFLFVISFYAMCSVTHVIWWCRRCKPFPVGCEPFHFGRFSITFVSWLFHSIKLIYLQFNKKKKKKSAQHTFIQSIQSNPHNFGNHNLLGTLILHSKWNDSINSLSLSKIASTPSSHSVFLNGIVVMCLTITLKDNQ